MCRPNYFSEKCNGKCFQPMPPWDFCSPPYIENPKLKTVRGQDCKWLRQASGVKQKRGDWYCDTFDGSWDYFSMKEPYEDLPEDRHDISCKGNKAVLF